MRALQRPVVCQTVVSEKDAGLLNGVVNPRFAMLGFPRSSFWGSRGRYRVVVRVNSWFPKPCVRRSGFVHCRSDGNGSMAGNFSENDEDYVNSSVIEAVEVKSGSDGFMIKMHDGRHLRCVHNNPQGGKLPDYAPHPTMVLKMEDGMEMPTIMLMAAVRNVQIARPTIYQVIQDMVDKMGYEVN